MLWKNHVKSLGFSILGILLFQLSFSQQNYLSGYVVKNNGDTLSGFIDYRNWDINPDKVDYKSKLEEKPIQFKPTEILEFGVKNEIYVSGTVDIEISPIDIGMLEEDPQIHIQVNTVFLQTLVKGEKSLFYYKNQDRREYFYIKYNATLELLIYKRYIKQREGMRVIEENNKYLGQLALYLNDCSSIQAKFENTPYRQKNLINLFHYYF